METIYYISNALAMIALVASVALVWVVVRRDSRSSAQGQKRDDLASMMILLQTMRDLLEQQKGLARELNKALDTRIEFIRQTVDAAREELKIVRESAKSVAADLEQMRREAEIARAVQNAVASALPPAPPANITPLAAYTQHHEPDEEETPREHERPVLRVLAMPREPDTAGDALDSWVGLDFAGDEPDPLGFEVPDEEPEAPHDADAARSAFRALLDLSPEERLPAPSPVTTEVLDRPVASHNGNGRPVPPVHTRVYEYNDAGMTVGQIAQELGIGKGEVRLILSLRKEKARE